MLDTIRQQATQLMTRLFERRQPAHRLNRNREIPPHRLVRLRLPDKPIEQQWPYTLTRHSLDARVDAGITPASWYVGGGEGPDAETAR